MSSVAAVLWIVGASCTGGPRYTGMDGSSPSPDGPAEEVDGISQPDVGADGSSNIEDGSREEMAAADTSVEACPPIEGPMESKIVALDYFSADPTRTTPVAVWLTETAAQSDKLCNEGARCLDDGQLLTIYNTNFNAIRCVLGAIGSDGRNLAPTWFEAPQHLRNGQPVPFLRAFSANLNVADIKKMSGHPFVERIEPAPRSSSATGTFPDPPAGCPLEVEVPDGKLEQAVSLRGMPRQPVVVELRDEGVLPAIPACAGDGSRELCTEASFVYWDRAILGVREQTCVFRRLEQIVRTATPDVAYSAGSGDWRPPVLPPLGTSSGFLLKAFGTALSWDEANELAKHLYVERIWTSPSLRYSNGQNGCPPSITDPILTPECPSMTSAVDGKISPADAAFLSSAAGPQKVVISVQGGAVVCPLERCSVNPCATNDAVTRFWTHENLASQKCVRELILSLSGSAAPDSFWLTNAFSASLDWEQIQRVAAHPHVLRVESSSGGGPAI